MEYNVLIVDDSKLIVNRLTDVLKELECISFVNAANSYTEALSLLEMHCYNLAILDINIPGKNGIELLNYIKENYPSLTTFMHTNQSGSYYREMCKKIGCNEYIDKTNDFDQIPKLIRNYFEAVMANQ